MWFSNKKVETDIPIEDLEWTPFRLSLIEMIADFIHKSIIDDKISTYKRDLKKTHVDILGSLINNYTTTKNLEFDEEETLQFIKNTMTNNIIEGLNQLIVDKRESVSFMTAACNINKIEDGLDAFIQRNSNNKIKDGVDAFILSNDNFSMFDSDDKLSIQAKGEDIDFNIEVQRETPEKDMADISKTDEDELRGMTSNQDKLGVDGDQKNVPSFFFN